MTESPREQLKSEIQGRLGLLKRNMTEQGVDCALILQNVDVLYYTGTIQDGLLLVPAGGEPVLFVRRVLERARRESPLRDVRGYSRLRQIAEYLLDTGSDACTLGLELDVVPAGLYLRLKELLPHAAFQDLSAAIRSQRAVKSAYEQALLDEAGRRFDRVLEAMRGEIVPGRTEYQVYQRFIERLLEEQSSLVVRTRSFNMEAEQRYLLGGNSAARLSAMDSPTAGGEGMTRAYPSGAGLKKVRKGEPFLIDSVFIHEGYLVDCTRVYAPGKLEPGLERAHGVSADCHCMFLEAAARGEEIAELYRRVSAYVQEQELSRWFMGGVTFIGHGVGLELDEFPVVTARFPGRFREGMVVAFEPKFVFPGGTAGFENTYAIRDGEAVALNRMDEAIQYL